MKDPRTIVYQILSEITLRPVGEIEDTHHLARDLNVAGDDYSMWLVPAIEKEFAINPTREEWSAVPTVGQVVELVQRHLMAG